MNSQDTRPREISFKVTAEESRTIHEIALRGQRDYEMNLMEVSMDVTAVHANGNPLDLAGLLAAEPFDFAHDIGGIRRHIDRTTGTLGDCFLPRYTARTEA